jgi:hypothetical protein
MPPSDPVRVLLYVAELLERIEIPYLLGGSLASSLLGEPRSTVDIDFAVALSVEDVPSLREGLVSEFYIEDHAMRDAVVRHASFNAIHQPTVFKVDFFVLGDAPFDRVQLERRRLSPVLEGSDRRVFVSSAEDLVLRKLDWFRQGGHVSDRQWRDVLGVLKVQAGRIDLEHLRTWADALDLADLLERSLAESGILER